MPMITVIEIDSEFVKIVQAQSSTSNFLIKKILTLPIRGLTPQNCASAIKRLISQNAIKIEKLIGVISRRDLTVRILSLPSVDKKELQQMVSLEAVKQIPFPPEETFYDYRNMEANEEGYSQAVLAIAHRSVINNIMEIFSRSGLRPDILTLTTEGLYLWAKAVLSEKVETKKVLLVMNIDKNSVEIEVIYGKRILLSTISSFGATSLLASNAEHKRHRERLLLEVKRSIYAYDKEQKYNLPIEKLVITGSLEAAKSISEIFRDNLGINTSVIESMSSFPTDEKALPAEDLPKDISICSSLGAVFALEAKSLSMLPPEIKKMQQLLQKSRKVITLVVLGAFAFVMITAAATVKFYQKKSLLNNINSTIRKISPVAEELETKFKKLQMMQSHITATKRPLAFLYELHRVIPRNVLLNYLSFDKKRKIILQGTTPVMSDVFKFVNMLEKSKRFKNVETRYVSKRRLKDKETVDFQIICEFVNSS